MEKKTTSLVTGKVRFSYLNVWAPKAAPGSTQAKYSVSILIPKTDKVTLGKIKAAINAAAEEGKVSKFGGKATGKLKMPVRDGDEERPDDAAYAGHYFINCSANIQPGIVDKNRQEILDHDELYSGCFGRVDINFYPFNTQGNKGVACGLNNIQKLADGEPLGMVRDPEAAFDDDFVDIDEEDEQFDFE